MVDEITLKVSNIKISSDENRYIDLDEGINTDTGPDLAVALVGKVLTMRTYNFEAVKRMLHQIWAISNGALFRTIENELFVVQFANLRDKNKVLVGRLWTFYQHLLM